MKNIISVCRPDPASDPWQDFIQVRLAQRSEDGTLYVAKPLIVERVEEPWVYHEPTFTLECKSYDGPSQVQKLMDQLWQLGIRPSDIGSPGHLAATQGHLADMRALVAKALEVKLP